MRNERQTNQAIIVYQFLSEVKHNGGTKTWSQEGDYYEGMALWNPEIQEIILKAGYTFKINPSYTTIKKGFFFDSTIIIPESITVTEPEYLKGSSEVFGLDSDKRQSEVKRQQIKAKMEQFEENEQ